MINKKAVLSVFYMRYQEQCNMPIKIFLSRFGKDQSGIFKIITKWHIYCTYLSLNCIYQESIYLEVVLVILDILHGGKVNGTITKTLSVYRHLRMPRV